MEITASFGREKLKGTTADTELRAVRSRGSQLARFCRRSKKATGELLRVVPRSSAKSGRWRSPMLLR
jgi:hypothetical protein